MGTAITAVNREEITPAQIVERVIATGDLSKLTPEERVAYYRHTCESLGLNMLTKPFQYIELDGKLTLYATRDCTDQIRRLNHVSITIAGREKLEDVYIVTARAVTPDGRTDESTGVVAIAKESGEWKTAQSGKKFFEGNGKMVPIRGNDLANCLMRCETKAKRRVTLSIVGLGFPDESELDTIPTARAVNVDTATGVIQRNDPTPANGARKAETPEQKAAAGQKYLRKEMADAGFDAWDIDQACEAIDAISDLSYRFQVYKQTHSAVKEKQVTDTPALMAFISDAIAEINAPAPEESAE